MTDPVTFVRDGSILRITLANPEDSNALDLRAANALRVGLDKVDQGVRTVVIGATSRFFSVGGNLRTFAEQSDLGEYLAATAGELHAAIELLADLPVPVIAVVQGPVAGGALGLLWASDIVLAADDVTVTLGYGAVGLTPDGGSSWFLPRLVGMRRALELVLLNRTLSAHEALEWGLFTEVVAPDSFDDRASKLIERVVSGATAAHGRSRRLLRSAWDVELSAHLSAEVSNLAESARTEDGREGVAAFAARRRPTFIGR